MAMSIILTRSAVVGVDHAVASFVSTITNAMVRAVGVLAGGSVATR